MAVQVVHFLEEIHVNHYENQIAVIHFADVVSGRALIISQDLLRFGGKNLFEITAIPHAGQHVGKGNFLQLQILPLQFQTVPAQRVLLAFEFVLQAAHFVQVMARKPQQAEQLAVEPMLLQKNQRAHYDHHGYRQEKPVGANALWSISAELRPGDHQRSYKYRDHGEPRLPDSVAARGRFLDRSFSRSLTRQKPDADKPRHSGNQWHVEKTAGVINMQINCLAGSQRRYAIRQSGHNQMEVDAAPNPAAAPPDENQTCREHELL